jgi:hypothetical protein
MLLYLLAHLSPSLTSCRAYIHIRRYSSQGASKVELKSVILYPIMELDLTRPDF